MSKRTPEEIIHSVERYQRGETSQGAEAKRLGVSQQAFQDWVRKYETFGENGFRRAERQQYSKELKLAAVQAYLNGEGSHAAICKKYGISSRTQLQNWIKKMCIRDRHPASCGNPLVQGNLDDADAAGSCSNE